VKQLFSNVLLSETDGRDAVLLSRSEPSA